MESGLKSLLLSNNNDTEGLELSSACNEPENKIIDCGSCKQPINYSEKTLCVQCLNCRGLTAVKPLCTLKCIQCGVIIYYLAKSFKVKCQCGLLYDLEKKRNL
jgi:hypothetical protein